MATYYIDYDGGSDANAGTSTSAAWKRHPYMPGFGGSYSHSAGDQFIFKGGVTWPLYITLAAGGSVGNHDYYGVDFSWYSGGSWSKPILDAEYTRTTCYEIGSQSHITIDNHELKRILCTLADYQGIITGYGTNYLIENCYIHGWRTTAASDGAHGGVIFDNYTTAKFSIILDNTEIENSENSAIQKNGVCVRMAGTIRNGCKIHDNSSGVLFCLDFDDSELYNITGDPFDGVYHSNGIYLDPATMGLASGEVGYIRYSRLHDIYAGANMAYPNVRGGRKIYIYNNVMYGHMSAQYAINVDPYQYGGEGPGSCYVWNNTVNLYDSNSPLVHVTARTGMPVDVLEIKNNHGIGTDAYLTDGAGHINTYIESNNLLQTPAAASTQGYVLGNLYAPTDGGSTINAGTSESGYFADDINGIARPQGSDWDIGCYEYEEAGSFSFRQSMRMRF